MKETDALQQISTACGGLDFSVGTDILKTPVAIGAKTACNRLLLQPMEGCDGTADGKPDALTLRRYRRFAESGAGVIWLEATAVDPSGRANPRQLLLNRGNADAFKALVADIRARFFRVSGTQPVLLLQATHSGRHSKPLGSPAPVIAYENPHWKPLPKGYHTITDDELKALEERYGTVAALAVECGFDGIDVKCCHGYLNSELLSARTRPGAYGGSLENRSRFFFNSIRAAKAAAPSDFIFTSRMNIYDGFPYPGGFGVNAQDGLTPDLAEPMQLIDVLHNQLHLPLLNVTLGNPYENPHVNRPYRAGSYTPSETPPEGVARILTCTGQVQKAFPQLKVALSGVSYLQELAPRYAAAAITAGYAALAGFGRMAFAYPGFAADLLAAGQIDRAQCCITCGKCSELMRMGSTAGCVVRDSAVYLPIYNKARQNLNQT
ncbi:MAG: flavin oxidoreductase/NADH oxidase [Oscillospiraceae bacterium]|jgi:2,4-dienoyl-CoA reductase-like NADH-dependent reductase (Old Yellow Enzyme family)|nr:flavin oxidoreductase/NADH oxidase [Oscillospiraceae bacterium]